jgi:hypothetical protein
MILFCLLEAAPILVPNISDSSELLRCPLKKKKTSLDVSRLMMGVEIPVD